MDDFHTFLAMQLWSPKSHSSTFIQIDMFPKEILFFIIMDNVGATKGFEAFLTK
jgi:hypothetical protein